MAERSRSASSFVTKVASGPASRERGRKPPVFDLVWEVLLGRGHVRLPELAHLVTGLDARPFDGPERGELVLAGVLVQDVAGASGPFRGDPVGLPWVLPWVESRLFKRLLGTAREQ